MNLFLVKFLRYVVVHWFAVVLRKSRKMSVRFAQYPCKYEN